MAFTLQGIGTTFYGQRDFREDGSYITTEWVVFLFIPVIPLRSLRVWEQDSEAIGAIYSKTNYAVLEKSLPNWKQVLCVYVYMGCYLLWIESIIRSRKLIL